MTAQEFITNMTARGAVFYPRATQNTELVNMGLRARGHAMLAREIAELYGIVGGANLGSGYIFGPAEVARGTEYPVPDLVRVNNDLGNIPATAGRTIFARNDLFWFAFDAFGTFYMLDNLTLRPLKKYDDGWRAMSDALMGGRTLS